MPAYPFIALFLAQYAIYITEYKTKSHTSICLLFWHHVPLWFLIASVLVMGAINLATIVAQYTDKASTFTQFR